jgi:CRP/FNR family transcriptional regulator, cyclic AMP receptor protein
MLSQETLAKMIGSSRSRVGIFMNKFGKVRSINYVGRLLVDNPLRRLARRD